jgi:hypothetical protein
MAFEQQRKFHGRMMLQCLFTKNRLLAVTCRNICRSVIIASACSLAGAELTSLVDLKGREILAEVVSLADGKVSIIHNKKNHSLPLASLDEATQKRVELVLEKKEQERALELVKRMNLPNGEKIIPGKLQSFTIEANDEDRQRSKCPGLKRMTVSIAFPEGFDPDKKWPVFFTNDARAGKNAAVTRMYQKTANALGYVVMGAHGEADPAADKESIKTLDYWETTGLSAFRAINELRKNWPLIMESDWSYGGFSGGAKNCCYLAVYLFECYKNNKTRTGKNLGFFMGGCNEMKMSDAVDRYRSEKTPFKGSAFFISNGKGDTVASPANGQLVQDRLNKEGFKLTRVEVYDGGHNFYDPHFEKALLWFKEISNAKQ